MDNKSHKTELKAQTISEEDETRKAVKEQGMERFTESDKNIDRGWAWDLLWGNKFTSYGLNLRPSLITTTHLPVFALGFTNFFICGLLYISGLFNVYFLYAFNESKATTAWIVGLAHGLSLLMAPFASLLVTRLGTRVTVVIGGIFAFTGSSTTYFADNVVTAIITYGLINGIGLCLVYYTSAVIIGFYFKKYRNLAFGFALAGVSTGIMLFPFLIEFCFEKYSPRGTLLIVGGIEAHTIVAGFLMRPIKNRKQTTAKDLDIRSAVACGWLYKFASSVYTLLSPQLVLYLTTCLCYGVGTLGTYAHLPAYLEFFNVRLGRISLVLTVMGIGSLLGRFSSGVFTHKSSVRTYITFLSCGIVAAVMEIAAPFIVKYALGQLVFGAVFSVSCNVFVPLMVPITMDLVPKKNMVAGTGLMYFVTGIGGISGAPLAGVVIDLTQTYVYGLPFLGIIWITGSVVFMFVPITKWIQNRKQSQTRSDDFRHADDDKNV